MTCEILSTLGPASLNDRVIARLEELGVTLFRINLSHTPLVELADTIRSIQRVSRTPVCLDSEGAQIRTGSFVDGRVRLRENSVVRAHLKRVPGDAKDFNFYPRDIIRRFEVGDFISIDFNAVLVQVIAVAADHVEMRVLSGGTVGSNRAVTVERHIPMPPLTEKDRAALAIGREMGLKHFALSFANRGSDVDAFRRVVGADAFVISKIECRSALRHLAEIAARSDALLIDRGDLAREMPIERIPRLQKTIIGAAKAAGKKVYVATNLLESMVESPEPTRAEINDIYNTLADGADGLVLAAETAIGRYPIRCAAMVARMVHEHAQASDPGGSFLDDSPASLLVPPHGGELVQRTAEVEDIPDLDRLPAVPVAETDLMDCEQIAHGTYSPLSGFMDLETLESVLADHRLPGGAVWTLPVILQVAAENARRTGAGSRVALADAAGRRYAVMDVSQSYVIDLEGVARRWFGTDSDAHPGVARLKRGGPHCLAGAVTLVRPIPTPFRPYQLTPAQTRFLFSRKGWSRVVGFHTRNAAHRVHEFIQLEALERTKADGLYINPVIGPKKPDDFLAAGVLASYQLMLEFGVYPRDRVLLGGFATYSRYSGPREAVFTALCRKNMGCSHFIVGRDHTGVGDFYAPEANRALFEALGDLGVVPVFFGAVGYNLETRRYEETADGVRLETISGTQVRAAIRNGRPLPDWFMREIVQEMFRAEIAAGRPVFHDGETP